MPQKKSGWGNGFFLFYWLSAERETRIRINRPTTKLLFLDWCKRERFQQHRQWKCCACGQALYHKCVVVFFHCLLYCRITKKNPPSCWFLTISTVHICTSSDITTPLCILFKPIVFVLSWYFKTESRKQGNTYQSPDTAHDQKSWLTRLAFLHRVRLAVHLHRVFFF